MNGMKFIPSFKLLFYAIVIVSLKAPELPTLGLVTLARAGARHFQA
jgi:hypothetical protein